MNACIRFRVSQTRQWSDSDRRVRRERRHTHTMERGNIMIPMMDEIR